MSTRRGIRASVWSPPSSGRA